MTLEDIKELKLPINNINDLTILQIESAYEWVKDNTKLELDLNDIETLKALPSGVRLFVVKFVEVMALGVGITSESIEGLSQSFDTTSKNSLLKQYAKAFLGPYLKGNLKFVPFLEGWRDF